MYIQRLGNFGSSPCDNKAIARMPNCGGFPQGYGWKASAAVTSYSDALLAAHAKNRSKYESELSKGDNYKSQLSGPIVTWLNTARDSVVRVANQALYRSEADAARFAQGQQAAAESWIRYKDYSEEAPDISRIVESAYDQSIEDITSGDPFRAAKKMKWGPDFLYGDNGFNYKVIGLILAGTALAIVAVYGIAGGIGKGLVS